MPFLRFFFGEGSFTEIDYGKRGALILTSLLEDLANDSVLDMAYSVSSCCVCTVLNLRS